MGPLDFPMFVLRFWGKDVFNSRGTSLQIEELFLLLKLKQGQLEFELESCWEASFTVERL